MYSVYNILKDISNILDSGIENEILANKLSHVDFNWELLVKVGSSHLILPAIFCKLQDKDLLKLVPDDLSTYLEGITKINRNRNLTIVEEVKEISILFNDNKIDHVFLKGSAMLVSEYYKDIGERMVGDIDILVNPDQILSAQELLLNSGYEPVAGGTFANAFFEHKHLPKLASKSKLSAVEIHRKVLHKSVGEILNPSEILKSKQIVNGINICDPKHLLIHVILNYQINDYGYYFNNLGLRNAYDCFVLLDHSNELDLKQMYNQKYIGNFFDKLSIYFIIEKFTNNKVSSYWLKNTFLIKQKYVFFKRLSFWTFDMLKFLGILVNRSVLFMSNSDYRKGFIADRKRIFKTLNKRLNPFQLK